MGVVTAVLGFAAMRRDSLKVIFISGVNIFDEISGGAYLSLKSIVSVVSIFPIRIELLDRFVHQRRSLLHEYFMSMMIMNENETFFNFSSFH